MQNIRQHTFSDIHQGRPDQVLHTNLFCDVGGILPLSYLYLFGCLFPV